MDTVKKTDNTFAVFNFHGVVADPLDVPDWCFHERDRFRRQLDYLSARFEIVSLTEAIRRMQCREIDTPLAALTFDDGLANNYEIVFPLLREFGVPATFFLVTRFIDTDDGMWFTELLQGITQTRRTELKWQGIRYDLSDSEQRAKSSAEIQRRIKLFAGRDLESEVRQICEQLGVAHTQLDKDSPFRVLTSREITELKESGLVEFGAHTDSHAILSLLSDQDQQWEIEKSTRRVAELLDEPCRLFAYPNGRPVDYDSRAERRLRECGIEWAFTTTHGVNDETTPALELRRNTIGGTWDDVQFESLVGSVVEALHGPRAAEVERTDPELTVAMPAYNAGEYIETALRGVLAEKNVRLEVIVVDDASTDNTLEVVRAIDDPRVTLLQNDRNRGISHCHNRVIEHSRAPFITHMDSDDVIIPGALERLVNLISSDESLGHVHCWYFSVDEYGTVSKTDARARWDLYQTHRRPGLDYKRELLFQGSVMNGLRTYRREVFQRVGVFDETLKYGVDLDMTLRLVDHYNIWVVPDFLYATRKHPGSTTKNLWFSSWRFWWQRQGFVRKLVKRGQIRFPLEPPYRSAKLLRKRFFLLLSRPFRVWKRQAGDRLTLVRKNIRFHVRRFTLCRAYQAACRLVPDVARRPQNGQLELSGKRIAHYQWRFPSASQTFIRREVKGLRDAGVAVQMFADIPGDLLGTDEGRPWVDETVYVDHGDQGRLRRLRRRLMTRHPLRFMLAGMRMLRYRGGKFKDYATDRQMFDEAVSLAGALEEHGIDHVHAAWADSRSFVAQLAATMLGITFSVQARAHDLHRESFRPDLKTRLAGADFIVTNSQFNKRCIESVIAGSPSPAVQCVYEGVELDQLVPPRRAPMKGVIRILSVARLIEEKGLIVLLEACHRLRKAGLAFECEIVGGTEEPFYTNYRVELQKRYRALGLQDCVFFRGHYDYERVVRCYSEADLFVLPCVVAGNGGHDISPNSLLEAMAMELPVITTTVSALPEIVEHEQSGLLVSPGDAGALAAAIQRLVDDPEFATRLGQQARQRIAERFDTTVNTRALASVFAPNAKPAEADVERPLVDRHELLPDESEVAEPAAVSHRPE